MSGCFQDLQRSWPTIFVPKGTFLSKMEGGRRVLLGIVLESTAYYAIVWKVSTISVQRRLLILIPLSRPCLELVQIQSFDGFQVGTFLGLWFQIGSHNKAWT